MNETLTVRDFGPIRNAEVTFKRVTVFIGPTGGGKSTLAKLAAVFRDVYSMDRLNGMEEALGDLGLATFERETSLIDWAASNGGLFSWRQSDGGFKDDKLTSLEKATSKLINEELVAEIVTKFRERVRSLDMGEEMVKTADDERNARAIATKLLALTLKESRFPSMPTYIPAERVFYGAVSSSLAGLMRDDIGLPKPLLNFVNQLWQARKEVTDLNLPMFGVKYEYRNEQDKIRLPDREEALRLNETASGIQAVAPLLVLLEHLSRQTERPQSFIIEEPELNLYPEAQQALVQTLIEKCTQGENDLIITTHSPYVLTVLNTLMYAHKVAHEVPANAKKVEKLVPRKYWIDPAQFAAYYVDLPSTKKKQQVRSIIDKKTGMIGENELDNLSFTLADLLGKLLDLRTPPKAKAPEKVQAS